MSGSITENVPYHKSKDCFGEWLHNYKSLAESAPTDRAFDPLFEDFDRMRQFGLISDNAVDWDAVIAAMPEKVYKDWQSNRLDENSIAAVNKSHYDRLVDKCIRTEFVDFTCQQAPKTTAECVRMLNLECSDEDTTRYCERYFPNPPMQCCEDPDAPANFTTQLWEKRCWEFPNLCQRSWAFGLHRDLECMDANAEIQSYFQSLFGEWRDQILEKERIALMFGLESCGDACSTAAVNHTWQYNGQQCPQYLQPGEGLYTNWICDPSLQVTGCLSDSFLCRLEEIWANMHDFNTCQPVECDGGYEVMIVDRCSRLQWSELIGPRRIERSSDDSCETLQINDRPGRDGWSATFKYSRYALGCLRDYYLNNSFDCVNPDGSVTTVGVAPNVETAEYRARNTYLVSRGWQDSFAMVLDFEEIRQVSGTNTWCYFDRGHTLAWREIVKYVLTPLKPWMTVKIMAFDPTFDALNP